MTEPQTIRLGRHELELRLAPGARAALARVSAPLYIDMELYFSCLVGKRVNFLAARPAHTSLSADLNEHVHLGFRVMLTQTCVSSARDDDLQVETIPVPKPERYAPRWLSLRYDERQGWSGEFGV